jgi:hypothetical protein
VAQVESWLKQLFEIHGIILPHRFPPFFADLLEPPFEVIGDFGEFKCSHELILASSLLAFNIHNAERITRFGTEGPAVQMLLKHFVVQSRRVCIKIKCSSPVTAKIRQEENMNAKRLVLIAVSVGVILMAYPSCDTSKKSYSREAVMEQLAGEWKNLHYDATQQPARRVFDQQGNLTIHQKTYVDSVITTGKITITKAWTDTEGLLWFRDKIHYNDSNTTVYELSKLDLQEMAWSILWSEKNYPEKWDAVEYESHFYRKF